MENLYKRVINLVVGWILIVCGIAGLFLPIVPGAPLLLAGVFILFSDCERLHRVAGTFRTRFPRLAHFFGRFAALEDTKMRQQMRALVEETYAMSARRKVLLFDEDVEALSKHAEPFETQGIEVHRCTTVEAAMRCVQREDFDLAL